MIKTFLFILLQYAPFVWLNYNQVSVQQVCFKDNTLNRAFNIDSLATREFSVSDLNPINIILLSKHDNGVFISEWEEMGFVLAAYFKDTFFFSKWFKDDNFNVLGISNHNGRPVLIIGNDPYALLTYTGKQRLVKMNTITPNDGEGTIYFPSSEDDGFTMAKGFVYKNGLLLYAGTYDINQH